MKPEQGRHSVTWKLLLAWAALLLLLPLALDPRLVCIDAAMYLECGARLLLGELPYVDFVDINPPLIMYLSVIPNIIAQFLSVHPTPVFNVLVIVLVLWSACATWQMLRRPEAQMSADEVSAVVLAWLLASLATWLFMPQYIAFGQREHLFMALSLPFVMMRFVRHRGAEIHRGYACLLGVAAGMGVALKMHFLLVVLAPEVLWSLQHLRAGRRSEVAPFLLRPEWAAFAAVGVLYLGCFLLMPGAMREAFFDRWVPLVVSEYSVYHAHWGRLIEGSWVFLALGLCIPAALLLRQRQGVAGLARPAAAIAAAGFLLYFGQHKYWPYHLVPAWTGLFLCCSVLLLAYWGRAEDWRRFVPPTVAALLLAGITAGLWLNLGHGGPREGSLSVAGMADEIERLTEDSDRVVVLSDTPWPAYPAIQRAERHMGTRFLFLFPLMMLNRHLGQPAEDPLAAHAPPDYGALPHSAAEAQVLDELRADLERFQPRLIIIPDWCIACPAGFYWWSYFQARGLTFEDYESIGHLHGSLWLLRRQ